MFYKSGLKIYNQIWINDDFPVSWRHAMILPVLKAGKDPLNPVSYRPTSLTPTLCKLMEKLVTNRLTFFVEKNNILNNVQCGFRKGRSTVDHIIRLQDVNIGVHLMTTYCLPTLTYGIENSAFCDNTTHEIQVI